MANSGMDTAVENPPGLDAREVIIIGGGPAGLTAAYELCKHGVPVTVLEADSVLGGIARTASYKGYLFDIGGHRFYTKVKIVEDLWHEILGDDMLLRQRLSRIYFHGKYFKYPLDPIDTVSKLGAFESLRCAFSWAWAVISPTLPEPDLQTWVTNRFGKRLFRLFFKSYTEKVWGMPCDKIASDWAAQRIRGLSFRSLVKSTLMRWGRPTKASKIKTLIEAFHYPRRGPGAMWERMAERIREMGGVILMNTPVDGFECGQGRISAVHAGGRRFAGAHFISSMPVRDLVRSLPTESVPEGLTEAAEALEYRDFITVALVIREPNLFPDNWIYIHEPSVKVGRIQNFKNWSPEMVPDQSMTCLGLEYFCFEGDDLWSQTDAELVELAKREIVQLGLAKAEALVDGVTVRMPKAYPVYNGRYKESMLAVREFLMTMPNLQLVGRNGMHQYNNQDHSMLTALLAARNVLGDTFDLWQVNVDGEYLEEGSEVGEAKLAELRTRAPMVPAQLSA